MESLNGQNSYTVTFAKDQTSPVHGFWSLTFITKGVLPPEVLGGLITRSNGHSSPSSVPIARFVLSAGVLKLEPLCGATAFAPMLRCSRVACARLGLIFTSQILRPL